MSTLDAGSAWDAGLADLEAEYKDSKQARPQEPQPVKQEDRKTGEPPTCVSFGELDKYDFPTDDESAVGMVSRPTFSDGEFKDIELYLGLRGEIGAYYGPGGSGKSMATLQLAILTAGSVDGDMPEDVKWLGEVSIINPGAVLYLTAEDSHKRLRDRIKSFMEKCTPGGLPEDVQQSVKDNLHIEAFRPEEQRLIDLQRKSDKGKTNYLVDILEELKKTDKEYALVILDPLSELGDPEAEKDNVKGRLTVKGLRSFFASQPGSPHVLVTHHTGKESSKEQGNWDMVRAIGGRGSSAIGDTMRTAMAHFSEPIQHPPSKLLRAMHESTYTNPDVEGHKSNALNYYPKGHILRINLGMKDNSENGSYLNVFNRYFMDREMGGAIRPVKREDLERARQWEAHVEAAMRVWEGEGYEAGQELTEFCRVLTEKLDGAKKAKTKNSGADW